MGFEPKTIEFRSDALNDWGIRPWVQLVLRAKFLQLLQFHLFVQCSSFISVFGLVSNHTYFNRSLAQVISLVAEWIATYGTHHWRNFGSSYRKLAWVGHKPTTSEFRSDAPTDWGIRPWVQLPLWANFVWLYIYIYNHNYKRNNKNSRFYVTLFSCLCRTFIRRYNILTNFLTYKTWLLSLIHRCILNITMRLTINQLQNSLVIWIYSHVGILRRDQHAY